MNTNLKDAARDIRCDTLRCIGHLGVGHIGGCLSVAELLAVLYFEAMKIDPAQPKMPGRDRFICSKGHAGPAVYSALANRGYFDRSELLTLNQGGTNLPSHCDMNRTVGVDMTTGSLGQGFSCAVGVALGSKLEKDGATIYALIGDGESQEGQIWEAAMFAAAKKLDNLIAFTDYNKLQIDDTVAKVNEPCKTRHRKRETDDGDFEYTQGLRSTLDCQSRSRQPQLPDQRGTGRGCYRRNQKGGLNHGNESCLCGMSGKTDGK